MGFISAFGNTPLIKLLNNGTSSEINFGITVSQNDLKIISYSNLILWGSFSVYINFLFKFPAEFRTDFNDLNPKS